MKTVISRVVRSFTVHTPRRLTPFPYDILSSQTSSYTCGSHNIASLLVFIMNGYHGDPETPDGFTRRHALLAGALYHRHIDHQQTVIPRCVGTVILSDDSVAPGQHMNAAQSYASPGDDTSTSTAPTLLDDGSYWSHSTDSCEAVPYQSSSYKAPTGYAYLQQQQAETQTSRDSEQTSWQAGAQSVVAATASTSASSNELTAQGIQHRQMPGSCRNQPHSPLLSTIDQLVSLQVRSDEVPSSFDDLSAGRADSSWPQNSQYVNPAQLQLPAGLQSQNEAGPWSTINPHNSISHREFEYQEQERTSVPLDGTGCLPTDLFSQNHGSLMPPEHTGMSNAAFNSDIEDIMSNSTTIRECEGYSQPLDLATHQIDQSQNNLPYEGVAFHCRLERAGTPQEVSTSGSYGQSDHRLV